MTPGETFVGYDLQNHLWIVLSLPTPRGEIALANLTTHGPSSNCGTHCVIVHPGEHSFVRRVSCIYYRGARLGLTQPLDEAKDRRTLRLREPFSATILRRVQDGALATHETDDEFKAAVRATLERGAG